MKLENLNKNKFNLRSNIKNELKMTKNFTTFCIKI